MSSEVPSDLINQSQIGFREDAGLSSFNPQDPTLKSLPTLQDSISDLGSSSSSLRCKQCTGKLLRGSRSLICIYCGQCQAKDLPPQPIFFNSTTGYRWLLQSLSLNPSEMIESLVVDKRNYKAGTPVEGVKALSEFLDVQIRWPDELEIPESGFVNKMFDHGSSSENFEPRDSGSDASEEHTVSGKSDSFKDQDNLSLFQKSEAPENDSDEHDPEIQPVNSRALNEIPHPIFVNKIFDHARSLNSSKFGSDKFVFVAGSQRDSGSDASDEHTLSSKNDQNDGFQDQDNLSLFQKSEAPETPPMPFDLSSNASSGHDSEIQPVNSRTHSVSFDLSRDSSSGDDTKIQSFNSRIQNEDSKTASMSSNLSDNGSSLHDSEIQPLDSRTQNEDSKTTAAMSSDLSRDSSS